MWSFFWSLVATRIQRKLYGKNLFIAWLFNFILAPLAIILAIVKKEKVERKIVARIFLSPVVMPTCIFIKLTSIMFLRLSDCFLFMEEFLNKAENTFGDFIGKVIDFIANR
jgi:large-conductance mechanosensitive channel